MTILRPTTFGEACIYITAAYVQLERGILTERVLARMNRARLGGKPLGRPGGTRGDGFKERWAELRPGVLAGVVGRREAARLLGVAPSTLRRLLQTAGKEG